MAYLDDNNNGFDGTGDPLDELDRELSELKATLNGLTADEEPKNTETTPHPANSADESENTENIAEYELSATQTATNSAQNDADSNSHSASKEAETAQDMSEVASNAIDNENTSATSSETADTTEQNGTEPIDTALNATEPNDTGRITDKDMKKTSKKPSHSAEPTPKKRAGLIILAIVLSVIVIFGIVYATLKLIIPSNNSGSTVETASGEMVTINDSIMGEISLQTVEGAEINTYTAENLTYDENGYPVYYEDGVKISHLGIDLSEYQGEVDFEAVKNAGVEFVMLRIGGRYYGESGGMYEDTAFDTYYEQAKAAGLKVGAYFFSQATSAEDAVEEATYALQKLNGRTLDYPIAFDWENIADDNARTDDITGDELTVIAEAFCDAISNAGYYPIVYSNTQQMFVMYDFETMKNYDFWLADYREFPTMYYQFDMWQYSMSGTVDGIEGTVDMNISFTDFS